jgi:hypothetical protein
MKIEMGESLMYSWLRHVKGCQVAQLNWKSCGVDEKNCKPLEEFYKIVKEKYKLKSTLKQFLLQAEVDVLAIKTMGNEHELYAVDIAFHEGGIGYKNVINTVSKKMIRSGLILNSQFGVRNGNIIFACPKVRDVISTDLNQRLTEIRDIFEKANFNFTFTFLFNDFFKSEVPDKVIQKSKTIKDTSDLFVRSVKIPGLFNVAMGKYNFSQAVDTEEDVEAEEKAIGEVDVPKLSETELKNLSYSELLDYYQENPQLIKIGVVVRFFFNKLESDGKLQELVDNNINNKSGSYDLLKVVNAEDNIKTLKKAGTNQSRYYDKIFHNNNKKYILCSQWYFKHIAIPDNIIKNLRLN